MPHIADVYAQELASHQQGHPLWFPEPDRERGEIQIGDVGFVDEGKFIKLFNVTDPPSESVGQPEDYVPLPILPKLFDERSNVTENMFRSHSMKANALTLEGTGEAVVAGAGAGYEFEISSTRGAVLMFPTRDNISKKLLGSFTVSKYIKDHFDAWLEAARNNDFDVKPEDLIFVRGWVKTDRWMVAAYHSGSRHHKGSISAKIISAGEVNVSISTTNKTENWVQHRTGPNPRTERTSLSSAKSNTPGSMFPTPAHSSGVSSGEIPFNYGIMNQCVFLPHYKMKKRLWLLRKIEAGAGPHQLPGHDDDTDGGGTAVVATDIDHDLALESPLDTVLEYILRTNAEAEAAVACEDDISGLLLDTAWPQDFREWLYTQSPPVEVEGGIGMLSIEDAINKRRLYDIRRIGRTWQEATINVANDDLSRLPNPNAQEDLIIGDGTVVLGRRLPSGPELRWFHLNLFDKEAEGGSVSSVSLEPNGIHIVTGSDDSYVRLWNLKTGEMVRKWEGHEDTVWSVMYSPDGTRIVSGSADTKIIVWDPRADQADPDAIDEEEEGEGDAFPRTLEEHTADVWTVVYSPTGGKFASGSVDCTVKIWDATSYIVLHTLPGHSANVMNVGWTPDERRVISCADSIGRIWDVDTGALLHTLNGHTASIWSMNISRAGDRVITGSEDSTSRIWSTETGEELVTIHEHTGPVWAVAFSPDGAEVASGSYDCSVVTNDSYSGELHHVLAGRSSIVDSITYSTDGKQLFSGAADGHVRMWDRERGEMIAELQGHKDKVKSLVFSKDDRELYSASDDGCVRVWNLQDLARVL